MFQLLSSSMVIFSVCSFSDCVYDWTHPAVSSRLKLNQRRSILKEEKKQAQDYETLY